MDLVDFGTMVIVLGKSPVNICMWRFVDIKEVVVMEKVFANIFTLEAINKKTLF